MKSYRYAIASLAVVVIIAALAVMTISMATTAGATEPCVPQDAWTETIEHPEVSHTEEVFDYWQRYSWTGGPWESDNPPPFPSDNWQPNVKGDPHGIGVEGAYFVSRGGSGKGDWFYLEAVKKTITVVDQPAWTETIEHPAVVCPDEPTETPTPTPTDEPTTDPTDEPTDEPTETPTDDPTETPTDDPTETPTDDPTETPTDEPTTPVDECLGENGEDLCTHEDPEPPVDDEPETPQDSDTSSQVSTCIGGALITKTVDADGNTSTSTVNGHPQCAQTDAQGNPIKEEGL